MNVVVEGELLDGPAIANALAPTNRDTFDSYACDEFTRFLSHRLADVKKIDVLWDRYLEESLKQTTCINRGSGIRLKVTGHDRLPNDWKSFLQCDENKKKLFLLLVNFAIANVRSHCILAPTCSEEVLCNRNIDLDKSTSCRHEEAD